MSVSFRKYSLPAFILLAIIFVTTFLQGCNTSARVSAEDASKTKIDILHEKIKYLISNPELFNAQIGVYIESLDRGEVLFAHNEHKLFISASNMKIFTTASVLLRLEPTFRYKTVVYTRGSVNKGILEGDLVIRGSGDPTIAPRFSKGDSRAFFRAWADSLKGRGINQIDGDIIGDASYFQTPALGYGWPWDNEPFWYSAQISALSFNDNCIDVTVVANEKIGARPNVYLSPPTSYVTFENSAITVAPDSNRTLFITRLRNQNKLQITDEIPVNKPRYFKSISIEDPAQFFVHVLLEVLTEAGIRVNGNAETLNEAGTIQYDSLEVLFTHQSPPLSEIITAVNKPSQNLYAEQLLITLAAEYGEKATAAEGTRVVTHTLARMGISESEFLMHDGSGLSRVNLISPNSVGLLLRYMAKSPYATYFTGSLPVAGVDGTLTNRMKQTTAEGEVRAKTGYVSHVRNLSGYVESANGEQFLFSILVNNYLIPTPAINLLQDRICILMANFSR